MFCYGSPPRTRKTTERFVLTSRCHHGHDRLPTARQRKLQALKEIEVLIVDLPKTCFAEFPLHVRLFECYGDK